MRHRRFTTAAASLAAGAACSLIAGAAAASTGCSEDWLDPRMLYGSEILFDVYRDGQPVGAHTVRFRDEGERLVVDTRFDLEVSLLFITAYRYSYSSTEVWQDGCLQSVRAVTNDNGDRSVVQAEVTPQLTRIDGPRGEITAPGHLFPSNHWNADVLDEDRVINTITGEVARVAITDRGADRVAVNGQSVPAQRYRYTGDLDVDVWYDNAGRGVKMRFAVQDGSTIDYVCRTCRGGPST